MSSSMTQHNATGESQTRDFSIPSLTLYQMNHWAPQFELLYRLPKKIALPLAIVAIYYLKCRVATNISHWLKVEST